MTPKTRISSAHDETRKTEQDRGERRDGDVDRTSPKECRDDAHDRAQDQADQEGGDGEPVVNVNELTMMVVTGWLFLIDRPRSSWTHRLATRHIEPAGAHRVRAARAHG